MTTFFSRLLDLLSPRTCAICGRRFTISEQPICATCDLHLPRTYFCNTPEDNEMARHLWALMPVQRAAALFFYQPKAGPSRMIEKLKYGKRPDIGWLLGHMTAREMAEHRFFEGIDMIVPLPLAKSRLRERGFNQSEEIAHGIAEVTGLTVRTDIVERVSFEKSQTQLGKWDRNENVKDAFLLVNKVAANGKHILLVDDIMTTGATIIACANAIGQADGVRFSVLTLGFTKN